MVVVVVVVVVAVQKARILRGERKREVKGGRAEEELSWAGLSRVEVSCLFLSRFSSEKES